MEQVYDILISGLGVYGASAFYHASKNNLNVIGIEQYEVVNDKNSSFGETRLTRQNVFEGTHYPTIAQKSQAIVTQLEKETQQSLQQLKGGLYVGLPNRDMIKNIKKNEKINNLVPNVLSREQLNKKFPVMDVPYGFEGVLEETAGISYVEKINKGFIDQGLKYNENSKVLTQTKLIKYEQKQNYIQVTTNNSQYPVIKAKKLIIAQGIGMVSLLRDLGVDIWVQKNQAAWIDWEHPSVKPDNLPIFYFDYYSDKHQLYGFPDVGSGLKIGLHKRGQEYTHEDQVDSIPCQKLFQELKQISKEVFPQIPWEKMNRVKTCCYTSTRDGDFVVDFHPQNQNVVLLSCCTGHGFKYAPQIGLDSVLMTQSGNVPYSEFKIERFKFLNKAKL